MLYYGKWRGLLVSQKGHCWGATLDRRCKAVPSLPTMRILRIALITLVISIVGAIVSTGAQESFARTTNRDLRLVRPQAETAVPVRPPPTFKEAT